MVLKLLEGSSFPTQKRIMTMDTEKKWWIGNSDTEPFDDEKECPSCG